MACSLVMAAHAAAQAPPQYWVRLLAGDLLNYAWRQLAFEDPIQDFGHAVLAPSGPNTWSGATDAMSAANWSGFAYGGNCQAAQFVSQSTSYPHLFVTDRSNLHAYSVDAYSAQDVASGYADYRLLTLVNCEEYSYVQFSKQNYGYVASWGGSPNTAARYRKEIYLNDNPVLDTGTQWGVPSSFYYSFFDNKCLVSPGQNRVDSRYSILAYGTRDIGTGPGLNWHTHETFDNVYNAPTPLPSQWWVYPVPNDSVHPSSYQVVNGTQTGGSLASLNASDDNRLQLKFNRVTPVGTVPSGAVTFTSTLPNLPDLALRVYVEASVTPASLTQTISLWNYQTSTFDVIDTRAATATDTFAMGRTEQLSKYVHPTSREVTCRVRWTPSTMIGRTWTCSIDEVKLMAFRR